jgi:hypothetical protein
LNCQLLHVGRESREFHDSNNIRVFCLPTSSIVAAAECRAGR